MAWTVTIRKNVIPQVQASIVSKSTDAIRDNAHFMQDYAAQIAPVRTGAFRESIYVNGPENESDYTEHAGLAKSRNPTARIVPELKAAIVDPKVGQLRNLQTGQFTFPQAIVSSAVEYSLYLEEGTVHMAPRPTLRPAALVAENLFKNLMSLVAEGF